MSRADDLAAKARRLRTAVPTASSTAVRTASSTAVSTARTAGSTAASTARRVAVNAAGPAPVVRTRPVRMTLDLPPAEHAALRQLCLDLAGDVGAAQLTARDILRALLSRVLVDEDAYARLRDDLRETRGA